MEIEIEKLTKEHLEEIEKMKRDYQALFRQVRVEVAQARNHTEKAVDMIEWVDKKLEEELHPTEKEEVDKKDGISI